MDEYEQVAGLKAERVEDLRWAPDAPMAAREMGEIEIIVQQLADAVNTLEQAMSVHGADVTTLVGRIDAVLRPADEQVQAPGPGQSDTAAKVMEPGTELGRLLFTLKQKLDGLVFHEMERVRALSVVTYRVEL